MTEIAYIKCVSCGMNKPYRSDRYDGGLFTVPLWEGDPANTPFVMFMEATAGPGRGRHRKTGGFTKTRELSLGEALADPEFRGIAMDYRAKLILLIKAYLKNGVFSIEELG